VGGAGSNARFGDSQDTPVFCGFSEGAKSKAKDHHRRPTIEFAEQPAVAVSDQIRAVAKERLRSRLGVVTTEEMAALEDGLRQIMQLG
jgi:mRNA-degrading endonuclease toxin of MazEF toxin-antitoxin module